MADTKISALTAVATPATTDEFPCNQGGTTKKQTSTQIRNLSSDNLSGATARFYHPATIGSGSSAIISPNPIGSSGTYLGLYKGVVKFTDAGNAENGHDAGLERSAAGVVKFTNGSTGDGTAVIGGAHFLGYTSAAGDPTTTELPADKDVAIHKNTSSGDVFLAFNDGGSTIVKVQLV